MRFHEIVFAACAAMPAFAWAQGVIPTNNAAIFSAQPVQAPSGTTTGTLATRAENRLDLVADFGADPTGATDISGALSAAIAAGRPVFIPAGTFLLSGSVTDPGAEPVNITCSGQATTTINLSGSIAISQTGNFTIPFSIKGCGFSFTGSGAITLAGTTYNNSQPLEGPVFQDDYFAVPSGYTGAGPVLGFSYVSSGNFINTNALINAYGTGILENFVEVSGVSMNWQFVGNQWWNNINGSNTANVSTGLFLNGSTGGGVEGTRISDSEIVGFSKNVFVGPSNNTVQISNSMLDQGYYPLYINGTSINDVRVDNTYMGSSAAASSGASAVYVGAANNVKISHNTAVAYNTGNYPLDLTNASNGQVTFLDNNTNGQEINNPNNVPLQSIETSSPIQSPNVLYNQYVYSSSVTLTPSQAGTYIFWTGATGTITLPNSSSFYSGNGIGAGIFYIQNNGSAPVNIVTGATDHNDIPGAGGALAGSASLPVGAAYLVIAAPGSQGWNALNYNASNLVIPTTATINGIAVGVTPSVATLGTNPPVSGTAYQWGGPGTLQLACPVTLNPTSSAAASVSLAIGSSSTLGSTMDAFSLPSGATTLAGMTQTEKADVPAGWYYGLTATNATIGTCAAVVH
jgi:hypothetical protein